MAPRAKKKPSGRPSQGISEGALYLRVPVELLERMRELAEARSLTISEAWRDAAWAYVREAEQGAKPLGLVSHDTQIEPGVYAAGAMVSPREFTEPVKWSTPGPLVFTRDADGTVHASSKRGGKKGG